MQVTLVQNMTLPFEIGDISAKNLSFILAQNYNPALVADINQENFKLSEGFEWKCHIPLKQDIIFNGPIRIKSFYDYLFVKIYSKSKKINTVKVVKLFYNTQNYPEIKSTGTAGKSDPFEKLVNSLTPDLLKLLILLVIWLKKLILIVLKQIIQLILSVLGLLI